MLHKYDKSVTWHISKHKIYVPMFGREMIQGDEEGIATDDDGVVGGKEK